MQKMSISSIVTLRQSASPKMVFVLNFSIFLAQIFSIPLELDLSLKFASEIRKFSAQERLVAEKWASNCLKKSSATLVRNAITDFIKLSVFSNSQD